MWSGEAAFEPGARLPPSITRLALRNLDAGLMVPLRALSNLRELTLVHASSTPEDYAQLAPLLNLTQLQLLQGDHLPGTSLNKMTQLRSLVVADYDGVFHGEDTEGAAVAAALPHLQQLTRLVLFSMPGMEYLPAGVAELSQLRQFCWLDWGGSDDSVLPAGGWLAGMEHLVLPCQLLASSLPALAVRAPKLACLGVTDMSGENISQHVRNICTWATRRQSLQRLVFEFSSMTQKNLHESYGVIVEAQRQRPDLLIHSSLNPGKELCGIEAFDE